MNEATQINNEPPKLRKEANGDINTSSLADLLEWFLNYDSRVGDCPQPARRRTFSMETNGRRGERRGNLPV
jgi:hypothetical protein